ncbi:hypothetical protein AGOR_G00226900 [Albula goreensis]|uniref:Adhesion G protein-coupled receptor E1 n=1 Tax=Albula goreensis TaxID=1534307 RepID=A0A8T3CPM8_9TELE|nr:hypothetical protein AGOR_G00226900 [Albula goreensis]
MKNSYFSLVLGCLLSWLVCCFCFDPCVNHTVLSDPWRNIKYYSGSFPGYPLCDSHLSGLWVRFTGIAGDMITERCIWLNACGSKYCLGLSVTHPKIGEGIIKGMAHFSVEGNCTETSYEIEVLACSKEYYVYRLPNITCPATFGVQHKICSLTSCGPLAHCVQDIGLCACDLGYKMPARFLPTNNSYGCTDIDECSRRYHVCGPNADCANTIGSFTCTCHQNYHVNNPDVRPSPSNPCRDTDECMEDTTICGPNANCTNIPASYTCTCLGGYQVISLDSIISVSNPCQDVDECSQDICGSNTVCYNTPGSYYCTCQDGYISSTGFTWETGVTLCKHFLEELESLTPPEGQSREEYYLNKLKEELANNPDVILSEGAVTSVLTTALSVTDNLSPEEGDSNGAEVASIVLEISEKLVSALIEPNMTNAKIIRTPIMEINTQAIGPEVNMTEVPVLNAKGNTMNINLPAIAKSNNGSAAAVLMSVSGMEKLMGPSFFETENVTEIYSDIITATLPKTNQTELPDPVKFTILHSKKFQAGLVTCVYWDDKGKEKNWSVDGCTATFSNETHTVCSCTHLSTFAILLQTEEQAEDDELLEWINLICMAVGLAFLGLAILSFLLCSWNPKINNTARLHLCICLFLGHLLFLLGVSRTENETVCAAIAGLLHFLFLSSFVFMLLETLQLFLLVRSLSQVRVIQKEGLRPLYLLLIGYGIPLLVVGVSAAVYPDGYGNKDVCWLQNDKNFQWSFIGPVCAILALNLVSFCVIIWSLQPTLANMKSDVSQAKDTRLILFKIVAQFFILGCSWILGFFQTNILLKYLFILLNSQQGTFIFIVHCLLNKEVLEEYKTWLKCLFRAEEPSKNSSDTHTVQDSGAEPPPK